MTIAKGAVLTGINRGFEVQELEWEEPRDDEVGIRVVACGVCHTDWHCAVGNSQVNYPCITGHEGAGIVEKVGKNVKRVKAGDKVVMSWIPSCGHCPSCVSGNGHLCDRGANLLTGMRDDGTYRIKDRKGNKVDQVLFLGAFSEYVVISEDGCIPVDKDLDLLKIPVVGCRVPTWGSVVNVAKATQGCTALVIGLGGVGFNVIQGLKCVGATIIIAADIHDKKRWAVEWGATHYIDSSKQDIVAEVMNITGIGVDYAFDAIGKVELQAQTVQALCKNGTAVWVGVTPLTASERSVTLDSKVLTLWQKKVSGSLYGGASPFVMVPQLIKMYRAGKIKFDQLITKYYELDQINEAFVDMLAGKNICGCVRMD
jgi:S-(hydroxymethyl)glutathione dehydrogenase/alcohol dehydrogenase